MPLTNNSIVLITEIRGVNSQSGGTPLTCATTFSECCKDGRLGEWYYPNGTKVKFSGHKNFYRDRTENEADTNGSVRLNRRSDDAMTPTGIYNCTLPGVSANATETLLVGVYALDNYSKTVQLSVTLCISDIMS